MRKDIFNRSVFSYISYTIIIIIFCLSIFSCAEIPLTERKGLRLIASDQLNALSLQQYSQVLKESKLSKDKKKIEQVQRVGKRIAKAAEEFMIDSGLGSEVAEYKWEFNLIEDDKTVNAWCMPGGKVAVYTGILPIAKDDNGLAVVMGHEVAHAIAEHGNERMSQSLLVSLGGVALAVAIEEKPEKTQELFMISFGLGASLGFILPYSRVHETEADRIGLVIMARAGYDPREAIPFWERMKEKGGSTPPEFLSTHPVPETRIEDLRSFIPEAMPYYEKSKKEKS
jgi:predicted Zn-dependent protease